MMIVHPTIHQSTNPVCHWRGGRVVYRGGLENRFGLTPDGGSNPSLSASLRSERGRVKAGRGMVNTRSKIVSELIISGWTSIIFWAVVIGLIFAYLWWQGQVRQLAAYVQETREELKKCSWPSWVELKGSTVVIMISIALIGAFTEVVDRILYFIFFVL